MTLISNVAHGKDRALQMDIGGFAFDVHLL